jgi:hypothetical protein
VPYLQKSRLGCLMQARGASLARPYYLTSVNIVFDFHSLIRLLSRLTIELHFIRTFTFELKEEDNLVSPKPGINKCKEQCSALPGQRHPRTTGQSRIPIQKAAIQTIDHLTVPTTRRKPFKTNIKNRYTTGPEGGPSLRRMKTL